MKIPEAAEALDAAISLLRCNLPPREVLDWIACQSLDLWKLVRNEGFGLNPHNSAAATLESVRDRLLRIHERYPDVDVARLWLQVVISADGGLWSEARDVRAWGNASLRKAWMGEPDK